MTIKLQLSFTGNMQHQSTVCALNGHETPLVLYEVAAQIILILYMESELREFKELLVF